MSGFLYLHIKADGYGSVISHKTFFFFFKLGILTYTSSKRKILRVLFDSAFESSLLLSTWSIGKIFYRLEICVSVAGVG